MKVITIFNATTVNSIFKVIVSIYISFNVNLSSAKLKLDWKLFNGSMMFLYIFLMFSDRSLDVACIWECLWRRHPDSPSWCWHPSLEPRFKRISCVIQLTVFFLFILVDRGKQGYYWYEFQQPVAVIVFNSCLLNVIFRVLWVIFS